MIPEVTPATIEMPNAKITIPIMNKRIAAMMNTSSYNNFSLYLYYNKLLLKSLKKYKNSTMFFVFL